MAPAGAQVTAAQRREGRPLVKLAENAPRASASNTATNGPFAPSGQPHRGFCRKRAKARSRAAFAPWRTCSQLPARLRVLPWYPARFAALGQSGPGLSTCGRRVSAPRRSLSALLAFWRKPRPPKFPSIASRLGARPSPRSQPRSARPKRPGSLRLSMIRTRKTRHRIMPWPCMVRRRSRQISRIFPMPIPPRRRAVVSSSACKAPLTA